MMEGGERNSGGAAPRQNGLAGGSPFASKRSRRAGTARRALVLVLVAVAVGGALVWEWPRLRGSPVAEGVAATRLLARAAARLDDHARARGNYAQLGGRGLEAEDHFLLGVGWSRLGQYDAARAAWRSALRADPD